MSPIRPENKDRYPKEWPEISRRVRQRAAYKCEFCSAGHGAWGYREAGKFTKVSKRALIETVRDYPGQFVKPPFRFGPHKIIEIVLTVAHLDHQPENCADENLKALCQRCHLAYDAQHHKQTAYATRRQGKAADMFEGNDGVAPGAREHAITETQQT